MIESRTYRISAASRASASAGSRGTRPCARASPASCATCRTAASRPSSKASARRWTGSSGRSRAGPAGARVDHVERETAPATGALSRFFHQGITAPWHQQRLSGGVPEGAHPPRPRFPEAGHPLLRHHDAAARAGGLQGGHRSAGDAVRRARASTSSWGSRAAGSSWAAPVADRLGAGFCPIRKPGKLPAKTLRESFSLEYGTDSIEIHEDAMQPGQRVLVVDDVLATGGTATAAASLVKQLGGRCTALAFLIELDFLNGRATACRAST